MNVVQTSPVRDYKGRIVRDPKFVARILAEVGQRIAKHHRCRVCAGDEFEARFCAWCVNGTPKHGCGDCEEPLPMCRCMRTYFGSPSRCLTQEGTAP